MHSLCMRDSTATIACLMLNALRDETDEDHMDQDNFPKLEANVYLNTLIVLGHLLQHGYINREQYDFSYVEPSCIEHNHVMVVACKPNGDKEYWLIDPVTGVIERY